MICLDIVLFSEVLRSRSKTANMTWLYSGTCWCTWFVEAAVWYGYSLCYSGRQVMCTAKEVVCLFTWRLFNIPMLHLLNWLEETVPSCIKCFINFSRMLCILENGALQKDAYLCIDVRVGDMTGHGSREDYSAFLCLIWHDLTRQCRAVLNVS